MCQSYAPLLIGDNKVLKCAILSVLKIDFNGDTFVARQRSTHDIFHFSL